MKETVFVWAKTKTILCSYCNIIQFRRRVKKVLGIFYHREASICISASLGFEDQNRIETGRYLVVEL